MSNIPKGITNPNGILTEKDFLEILEYNKSKQQVEENTNEESNILIGLHRYHGATLVRRGLRMLDI